MLIFRQTVRGGDPLSSKSDIRGLHQQNPPTFEASQEMYIRYYAESDSRDQ